MAEAEWAKKNGLQRRTEKQERARSLCKEFGLSVSCKAIGVLHMGG